MRQLGCSTLTFRMLDRAAALDQIAAAGFKTIDLGVIAKFCPHANPLEMTRGEHRRLADEIAAHGLTVSTLNAWSLTALNRPEGPDEEMAWLRASLRLAAALGCSAISMQPGRRADANWSEQARLVARLVNELGAYARDVGTALTAEAPHKGTLAETFAQALDFLDLVDPDLVGVTLDTSHIHNGGSTLAAALDAYGDRVRHVHVRDFKDGSIMTTPGDGECDFAGFFQAMEARGFTGDYNLELEYRDSTAEFNRKELERAAAHLRPLLPRD
ncbi:MAG: sugar phosphate isomerase/epimerase [Chloroflexi bacterium]|nr:sugar phosphate isomerase/epimerase [Chloroflexota bacterium]